MPIPNVSYPPPLGNGVPTPTGQLVPPQSPSGGSPLANNFTGSWNFVHSMMSVQVDLNDDEGPQQGLPAISNVAAIQVSGVSPAAIQVFRWS
jgi:hypothetical protein